MKRFLSILLVAAMVLTMGAGNINEVGPMLIKNK